MPLRKAPGMSGILLRKGPGMSGMLLMPIPFDTLHSTRPAQAASNVRNDLSHPGVELRANLKSISHRSHLFEVTFVWELTKETIHLPLGCLQGVEGGLNIRNAPSSGT